MFDGLGPALLSAGFATAFLHAALPTHWLPFALTARAQGWSRSRTVGVTAAAAGGHVAFTIVLGAMAFWLGTELSEGLHEVFHLIAAGILFAMGGYYIVQQVRGKSHGHTGLLGSDGESISEHHYDAPDISREIHSRRRGEMSIGGLVLLLTLSPCESFIPVYLSGAPLGWAGFFWLSVVLLVATVGAILAFTMMAFAGIERIRLDRLERYENALLGSLLVILGIILLVIGG